MTVKGVKAVCIELLGESTPLLIGTLHAVQVRGRSIVGFMYAAEWLGHPARFNIDPELQLHTGMQYPSGKELFNALSDAAPDRWGRYLVVREEKRRATSAGERPRRLTDIDYLLGIRDVVRMGAYRIADMREDRSPGPYLATGPGSIPPLIDLRKLQNAVGRIDTRTESDEDLQMVFAPGSSLGGARPKAVVRDPTGYELVAKFERVGDEHSIIRWEAVCLKLAQGAGITVPRFDLLEVQDKAVLLMERFDRDKESRIPFASALTMIGASDGAERSYIDIAESIIMSATNGTTQLEELWRRMVFNVMVSNTDDHLRNHGFLWAREGWELSPAYDMNPVPEDVGPRVLSLALDDHGDRTASLQLALDVAGIFRLSRTKAEKIAHEVAAAISIWPEVAKDTGIGDAEVRYMASAFEHEDAELAKSFS